MCKHALCKNHTSLPFSVTSNFRGFVKIIIKLLKTFQLEIMDECNSLQMKCYVLSLLSCHYPHKASLVAGIFQARKNYLTHRVVWCCQVFACS